MQVHGLRSAPHYNGQRGIVRGVRADGRLEVRLQSGTEISIRPENTRPVMMDSAPVDLHTFTERSASDFAINKARHRAAQAGFRAVLSTSPELATAAAAFFDTCHYCQQKGALQTCTVCKAAHHCNDACRAQDTAHAHTCVLCVCTLKIQLWMPTSAPVAPLPYDAGGVLMRMGNEAGALSRQAISAHAKGRAEHAIALCERAGELRMLESDGWIAANDPLGALKAYHAQAVLTAVVHDVGTALAPIRSAQALLARTSQAQLAGGGDVCASVTQALHDLHTAIHDRLLEQARTNFLATLDRSAQ